MSPAPRKKAARKSPAERSAEIAQAARDLALEQGLAGVTLRALAARIDVTPALVAHYEPSMDVVVADAFGSIVATEIDEVQAEIASLETATARMMAMVDTLLDGTRDDVTVVWVEAWALGRRNEKLAAQVRTQMDAWQAALETVIADGVAAGEFDVTDAAATAWQVLGMIDGLNAQALVRWNDAGVRGSLLHRALEGMLGVKGFSLGASA
ncbi:TetR/AcrR family transcriptional regulator [Microbacterium sp. P01]|uniref:TetR/AcrR family transcriptional regulator n=1 Tax=unclassified Microbacterium TaxID=2609290 RepID=UPI00367350A8